MGGIARLTGKMGLTGEEVVLFTVTAWNNGLIDGRWQSTYIKTFEEYDSSMVGGGSRVS